MAGQRKVSDTARPKGGTHVADSSKESKRMPSTLTRAVHGIGATLAVLTLCAAPQVFAHWPDQPPHQYADLGEFEFEGGGKIPNLRMTYVTHGKLNATLATIRMSAVSHVGVR